MSNTTTESPSGAARPQTPILRTLAIATGLTAIETQLTEESDGVFDLTVVEDRAEAVEGIEERDYFGAIVFGTEPELLTASANGDNPHHHRTKLVTVTSEGQQALDYMGRRQARWANRIGGQHDPGQMRTAAAVLRRLRERLEQDERGRDP